MNTLHLTQANQRARSILAELRRRVREVGTGLVPATALAGGPTRTTQEIRLRFAGRTLGLTVHRDTIESAQARALFRSGSSYCLPAGVQPKAICDIGAGIGLTAVYYAVLYPQADIYCFEPLPENVDLLRRNVERCSTRVQIIARGVCAVGGKQSFRPSTNPAVIGGEFVKANSDLGGLKSLPTTTLADASRALGIQGFDVVKLNAPGVELALLRSLPDTHRLSVQAYVGHLHGDHDWAALEWLSVTHKLQVHKPLGLPTTAFLAVRKDLT